MALKPGHSHHSPLTPEMSMVVCPDVDSFLGYVLFRVSHVLGILECEEDSLVSFKVAKGVVQRVLR